MDSCFILLLLEEAFCTLTPIHTWTIFVDVATWTMNILRCYYMGEQWVLISIWNLLTDDLINDNWCDRFMLPVHDKQDVCMWLLFRFLNKISFFKISSIKAVNFSLKTLLDKSGRPYFGLHVKVINRSGLPSCLTIDIEIKKAVKPLYYLTIDMAS